MVAMNIFLFVEAFLYKSKNIKKRNKIYILFLYYNYTRIPDNNIEHVFEDMRYQFC